MSDRQEIFMCAQWAHILTGKNPNPLGNGKNFEEVRNIFEIYEHMDQFNQKEI